jgi:energy-coupling factor transporter ATP-binding protein EcfA2
VIEELLGFVGQEAPLEAAFAHHNRGRSVVFIGATGSGKTTRVAESARVMSERRAQSLPMFLDYCNPIKQFVMLLMEKLHRRKLLPKELNAVSWDTLEKRLSRHNYRQVIKIAITAIRAYPGLFIGIDDIDTLTPGGRIILVSIIDAGAIVCCAATKRTNTMNRVMVRLHEVPIPPLKDDIVKAIAKAFLDNRGKLVEDRQHFLDSMVWKAAGNPLELDKMLRDVENEPMIRVEDVRKIEQSAGRKEVSVEWFIYLGFSFIVMLRFVSRATMNKQLYIITSVIAALFIVLRFVLIRGNRKEA